MRAKWNALVISKPSIAPRYQLRIRQKREKAPFYRHKTNQPLPSSILFPRQKSTMAPSVFFELKCTPSAIRCPMMDPCAVLDLVGFVNAIIGDVNKPASATLFEVAPALGWNPLALAYVVVFRFTHARDLFHVRNSAASGKSGKQRIFLVPSEAGSTIAVMEAPNFWLP